MFQGAVWRWSALPLVVAAVAVACREHSGPLAPDGARAGPGAAFGKTVVAKNQILKRSTSLASDIVTTATITPAGGWLQIKEAGLILIFPNGAVTKDLAVTAIAHRGNRVVYSFEPHGTVFHQPVYVVQELRYTEAKTPKGSKQPDIWGGYLANGLSDIAADGTGSFAEVFAADFYGKGNAAIGAFAIGHFSGYAYASGRY
jgi:hypothetical protein